MATIKKTRRTEGDIVVIKSAIIDLFSEEQPMTCRQAFYRLVSKGVIKKLETEYQNVVIRLVALMRRAGEMPFEWVVDSSRWMRKPLAYAGIDDALGQLADDYRGDPWENQDHYIEIWVEKESLAGVFYGVTARFGVPLMVCRGYPSLTFLHEAAKCIERKGKPTFIYYFGDRDPSGVDIPRFVEQEIRTLAPGVDLMFDRVAVNPDQIKSMGLLTRPTKTTDSRSKSFSGESVEVDSIPPVELRAMVEACIVQHIDKTSLERHHDIENFSRIMLRGVAKKWRAAIQAPDDEN